MGNTLEYAEMITVISLLSFILFSIHLTRAVRVYQHHHDDRAAVGLVLSVSLLVISAGMVISGVGLWIEDPDFAVAGLSITRGALVMVALTLIFADVRRAPDPAEKDGQLTA